MEKQITFCTYWLGVACLVIALALRVAEIWMGPTVLLDSAGKMAIGHLSLYKGALVFFLASIASAVYAWAKAQKAL